MTPPADHLCCEAHHCREQNAAGWSCFHGIGLSAYRKTSPGFNIEDTDLIDDLIELGFAGPIAEDNLAVSAGYWIMLAPLRPGDHEIHFHAQLLGHPLQGDFALDVTYHLTVVPGKK